MTGFVMYLTFHLQTQDDFEQGVQLGFVSSHLTRRDLNSELVNTFTKFRFLQRLKTYLQVRQPDLDLGLDALLAFLWLSSMFLKLEY